MQSIEAILDELRLGGNFRTVPAPGHGAGAVDFTANDYLGLGEDTALQEEFFADPAVTRLPLSACASRLLASRQEEFHSLEQTVGALYGREALLFNSGYHANAGLISALADKDTLIVADKLVHASIIDGYRLGDAPMVRFRHNDMNHLESILASRAGGVRRVLIVVESVYSMDGDSVDVEALAALRRRYDNALLYVDEAHAFGVCGPRGLGLFADTPAADAADIIVGTLGKAAAAQGAFAVMSPRLRDYAVNRARSFIFSTALPPLNCAWARFVIERIPAMGDRRRRLMELAAALRDSLGAEHEPRYITPYIVGSAAGAVELSRRLLEEGIKVLPIRTPTVPPGTERLRLSLSAARTADEVKRLARLILSNRP